MKSDASCWEFLLNTHRKVFATGALAAAAVALTAAPVHAENDAQPLITIGTAMSLHAAPWQVCASDAVAGVGAVASNNSAKTQIGDCANNQTRIRYTQPGVISILDGTAIDAAPWQICGSNAVGGVGLTTAVNSPKLLDGDCHNSNTDIAAKGPHHPSLVSVLSGSSVKALAWQVCGATAVAGVGAVAASGSPTTVTGNCTNAGTKITPAHPDTVLPLLSGVPLNVLPLQACEDTSLLSLVGVVVPLNSDAHVTGTCTTPDGLPSGVNVFKPGTPAS